MKTKKLIVMLAACAFSATGVYAQRVEPALVDGNPVINCDQMPAAAITSTSKGSSEAELRTPAANETVFHRFAVAQADNSVSSEWSQAFIVCSKLGSGWRLPTQRELMLMYVLKNELEKAPGFTPFIGDYAAYWSASSAMENYDSYHWHVIFSNGDTQYFCERDDRVRCLREL